MFKLFLAPISVLVAFCKALVTTANGLNNLAEAFDATTKVANNAATTWLEEETAVNAAKLHTIRENIRLSQEQGKPYQRVDNEIQL